MNIKVLNVGLTNHISTNNSKIYLKNSSVYKKYDFLIIFLLVIIFKSLKIKKIIYSPLTLKK